MFFWTGPRSTPALRSRVAWAPGLCRRLPAGEAQAIRAAVAPDESFVLHSSGLAQTTTLRLHWCRGDQEEKNELGQALRRRGRPGWPLHDRAGRRGGPLPATPSPLRRARPRAASAARNLPHRPLPHRRARGTGRAVALVGEGRRVFARDSPVPSRPLGRAPAPRPPHGSGRLAPAPPPRAARPRPPLRRRTPTGSELGGPRAGDEPGANAARLRWRPCRTGPRRPGDRTGWRPRPRWA